jgi:hypothetical protein
MRTEIEQYFLNPPPGSAAERAAAFGIDLTLQQDRSRLSLFSCHCIAVTQIPLVAIAEAGLGQVVPHCRQTALSPDPTQSLCGFATVARNDSSAGRRRRCQGV